MPNFFNFNFMEHFPVPSLRNYVGFSVVLFSAVVYYAYDTVVNDESWQVEFNQKLNDISETTRDRLIKWTLARIFYFLLTEQICIWTVVNTACCVLVVIGKILQSVVFGRLRVIEHQQMRDRFWNFVFYKFVFVFGVMNVQYFDEVVLWSIWFAICGFFYLLTSLAQDRFKYVSSSPMPSRSTNIRILLLLSVILMSSVALFVAAAFVSVYYGWNYGGFLAAECVMLFFRALHGVIRYGAHLYDNTNHHSTWEERTSFVYYTELMFELLILLTDFIHHIHMLIWSNIFLSMASLVICMQLKHLYQEIDRRLRRHRNYQRIVAYVDLQYPMATVTDIGKNDDKCAICWDRLETARKLPCGHMFHNWCLRGWLEQDTSCPTCRKALSINNPNLIDVDEAAQQDEDVVGGNGQPQRRRHRTNHFFHFDGRRYARWLPSFSVEVSHNIGGPTLMRRNFTATNSQLSRMAEQVREMFPHIPMASIEEDIQETNSVELTVDNILAGRLNQVEGAIEGRHSSDDGSDSEFESENGSTTDSDVYEFVDQQEPSSSSNVPASTSTMNVYDRYAAVTAFAAATSSPVETASSESHLAAGVRFSKSTEEREAILADRKRQIIEENRKKYLTSSRASELGTADQASSASSVISHNVINSPVENLEEMHARRRMLFNAAQRRFQNSS